MVRPVEQIEQEIAKLDQAVRTIAQEFHDTYTPYLAALGKTVRQQLVLASYHICTHGYPEQFLQLSLHQRQELQRSLRQLAKRTQAQLTNQLQAALELDESDHKLSYELSNESESEPDEAGFLLVELDEAELDAAELDETEPDEAELDEAEPDEAEPGEAKPDVRRVSLDELLERSPTQPITPIALADWQEQLEQDIVEHLQNLSHAANRLLQQSKILPSQLPAPILEIASRADVISETPVGSPNLISLLIESDSEDSAMTQITTIRLHLSEIEFSDTTVALWRSKVRTLVAQLNKLGREYQKRQKEKAIAQAESAWRSSWYED
ncbi:MAG: hypothetical protein KME15_12055 [Drouetiella hepatica Uher 2000/2452]|jgi:hypothetical protein|uniref:Uncharacterized protein n=1 Tax=Drouetiella hepatica Uher 2000/2452 TaxID=904376 RepID=A0A951QCS2_9CYAN|nr:hypothetical protein [Drouetiella hepatica Uher 2000/2452]